MESQVVERRQQAVARVRQRRAERALEGFAWPPDVIVFFLREVKIIWKVSGVYI